MKLSVSSYSFSRLVNEGKMSLMDCVYKTKELGFDAIEFAGIESACKKGESLEECALKLREECEKIGLGIANYTIAADLINGYDGGKPEDEVARLKKEVDIAAILAAPGMRHDATWGFGRGTERKWQGFDDLLPKLADGCREVAEYAASKGIRTMIENHGLFVQDSDRVEKLINKVAHENFGLLCDIGNFMCVDEEPIIAVSRTAPYAFHVHVKDFHVKSGSELSPGKGFFNTRGGNHLRGAVLGHGVVPVLQCLKIVKNAGYDGYISLEFEGIEDPLLGISIGVENMRAFVAALEV